MNRFVMVGLALVLPLGTFGCVSNSKYSDAVSDADMAQSELQQVEAQKDALEQQVRTLKELNSKLSQEAQLANDELQRIEHGRDQERGSLAGRTQEMQKQIRMLAAQHQALRKKHQDTLRHNKTLKNMVTKYQKELKARSRTSSPMSASVPEPKKSEPIAKAQPKPQPKPKPIQPLEKPVAAPPPVVAKLPNAPAPAPLEPVKAKPLSEGKSVNMNTASSNDMVLFLGLTKEQADRVVNNRPYRIKGELVAKSVIPKAKFDSIKGQITVKQ